MIRRLSLSFDRFGLEALRGQANQLGLSVEAILTTALRHYLEERRTGRPAARVPAFAKSARARHPERFEFAAELDDEAWRELLEQGEQQGVSVEKLAEHAAMLLLADIDSGRVAIRAIARSEPGLGPTA